MAKKIVISASPTRKRPTLEDFNKILQRIAESLVSFAAASTKKKHWKYAYLDERSAPDDDSRLGKLRIVLSDESTVKKLHTPRELKDLVQEAWEIKDKVFPDKWYGLVVKVYPNGKCETEFNYDPECVNDETFFDC